VSFVTWLFALEKAGVLDPVGADRAGVALLVLPR
jgi:hypothetical protein